MNKNITCVYKSVETPAFEYLTLRTLLFVDGVDGVETVSM